MTAIKNNSLANVSDSQLLKRLDDLVRKERQTTLEVLQHIMEMDRRSLYLGRGYASLYEYCTRHLGYSESAAFRRIQTARCIRDFPDVREMLAKNELNLTIVSKLAGVLTDDNKDALLQEARYKSTRHVEAIVARNNPRSVIRDRVRTIFVRSLPKTMPAEGESKADKSVKDCIQIGDSNQETERLENWVKFTSGADGKKLGSGRDARTQEPVLEKKFKIEFAVDPAFMKKLEEARALLSTKYPHSMSFEQLFEVMLDEYLKKHSPRRKDLRRKKRKAKSIVKKVKINASENCQPSRHIPTAVRGRVFARDKGRCTFVGPGGVRCNSTWNLQIDHITPFARGGDHAIRNLRLLCAKHNKHEAERIYGRGLMEQRMDKKAPKRE